MHKGILKFVYTYNELLHVSANHVAIFIDIQYKGWIHSKYKMKL
jgi:hypothetical protein